MRTPAQQKAIDTAKELAENGPSDKPFPYFSTMGAQQNAMFKVYWQMPERNLYAAYKAIYKNNNSEQVCHNHIQRIINGQGWQSAVAIMNAEAMKAGVVTLEDHITRLRELGEEARKARQYSAAITAETNVGKASGLYVNRTELTGRDGAPIGVASISTEEYLAARAKILNDV